MKALLKILSTVVVTVSAVGCQNDACMPRNEASKLREQLRTLMDKGVMLGHQDDLAYGCLWFGVPEQSDVKLVSGDYPAVFGWDISSIETGSECNPDSVKFADIDSYIRQVDALGGISTLRWSPSVEQSLTLSEIASQHDKICLYDSYLDSVAEFVSGLTDSQGNKIPVILQPLFNPNAEGQWWSCRNDGACTLYKQAWAHTVDYLCNCCHVDNLLFAFSLLTPRDYEEWIRFYPGNEYVDIVGVDVVECVDEDAETYAADFSRCVGLVTKFAAANGKIPTITASCVNGMKRPDFYTGCISPALTGQRLSYLMFWKNSWKERDNYSVPFRGHPAADDFARFAASPEIITCKQVI